MMLGDDAAAPVALYVRAMKQVARMLRAGDHPELVADGLLALALTVFGQLNLRFHIDGSTQYGSGFAAAAATAIATAAIALRRRARC